MVRRLLGSGLVALVAAGCSDATPAGPDHGLSGPAELYLSEALDIMQQNSLRRHEIDWASFRDAAFSAASGAQRPEQTYPAIIAALDGLEDGHSFFQPAGSLPPSGVAVPKSASGPGVAGPTVRIVHPGIGYVEVPPASIGGDDGTALAQEYHSLIAATDVDVSCRWVVDLRGNTGGNMWPMIAGLGPLLDDGAIGFFIDPDGLIAEWFVERGGAGMDEVVLSAAERFYDVEYEIPHVAVLTDSLTASAGEGVAVAFRGRDSTRSFGEPTWGVSTANAAFDLVDGARLVLTVATMGDRRGNVYGGKVIPDELVLGGRKTGEPGTDVVLEAALQWLLLQECA